MQKCIAPKVYGLVLERVICYVCYPFVVRSGLVIGIVRRGITLIHLAGLRVLFASTRAEM